MADRLGVESGRVVHGSLDGRWPLTNVSVQGQVAPVRREELSRQVALLVWEGWPDSADTVDVYLREDAESDPVVMPFGRPDQTAETGADGG